MNFKTLSTKTALTLCLAMTCLLMMESANAAVDLFDNLSRISGKLPVVKVIIIYVVFLIGLGILAWAAIEAVKISKPENRGEATWTGILIKAVAGVVMMALTGFSDTMQMTIFNTTQSAPSNVSMVVEPPRLAQKLDFSKFG